MHESVHAGWPRELLPVSHFIVAAKDKRQACCDSDLSGPDCRSALSAGAACRARRLLNRFALERGGLIPTGDATQLREGVGWPKCGYPMHVKKPMDRFYLPIFQYELATL